MSAALVPVVVRVEGHTINATACLRARLLEALLPGVVAGLTEWLPVAAIPEQLHVPAVGDDVVNDRGRGHLPLPITLNAERVLLEIALAGPLPPITIATLRRCTTAVITGHCPAPGGGNRPVVHARQ